MKESARTIVYVALAAVALLAAWVAKPAPIHMPRNDEAGKPFFPAYDPLQASTLRIVQFDEESGQPRTFEVAKIDGLYCIPSHENYPADAQTQLADVASSLVGLERGTSVSDRPGDHALYGVLDPTQAKTGASGVGTRITLENESGTALADLIVGQEVKNHQGQRFVREPSRDWVYQCTFPTAKLSTRFMDWIEKDLLQIDATRISSVLLDNYSIDEFNGRIVTGSKLRLNYDSKDRAWSLEGIAENESLLSSKVDDLKRAIDELAIVNVHRKPESLSKTLQSAGQQSLDQLAAQSLAAKGYYIVSGQLLSNEGETIVTMLDGVEYVLRFGEVTLNEGDAPQLADSSDGGGEASAAEEQKSDTGRYLFITARFNQDVIPQPSYVPMEMIDSIQEIKGPEGDAEDESEDAKAKRQEELEKAKQVARDKNETLRKNYESQLETARKRVADLNARFADWYYVIADDVYRKIHLTREEMVNKAEPPAAIAAEPGADDQATDDRVSTDAPDPRR